MDIYSRELRRFRSAPLEFGFYVKIPGTDAELSENDPFLQIFDVLLLKVFDETPHKKEGQKFVKVLEDCKRS